MKNIQVSDEMYDKLIELAKEYVSQDHRATRMPYLFQIQEQERVYYFSPEQGENPIWHNEEEIIENFDEFKDYLDSREFDYTKKELENINLLWNNPSDRFRFKGEYIVLDTFMEKYCSRLKAGSYSYKPTYKNAFFTAKGCKEHIEANKHNLHSPVDYLNYAERNPEMELISNFLCEIAKI